MADCCVGLMGRMCHQQAHCLLNRCGCHHCHRSHHRCHCTPLSSSYPQCVLIVDLAGHCCRGQWRPQRSTRPTIIACWSCPLHCPHSHCFDIAVTESSLCHCRRSSLSAESSKLSRRDPWFNPLILHLLGKGQRTIAIAATAIGANANTDAGANVCSQVIVFVIVSVIPLPSTQSRALTASIVQRSTPRDRCPWISCWRRCPPSSLPCSNPEIPHNRTRRLSLSCCNLPLVAASANRRCCRLRRPNHPPPPISRLIVVSLSSVPPLTLKGACLVVSDAAAMPMTAQSVANGGPDDDDNSAEVTMQ
jgi:hypothetical protein